MQKLSGALIALFCSFQTSAVSEQSENIAAYAVEQYQSAQIHTLANLVSFPTVNTPDISTLHNPAFIGFKQILKMKAAELGLDYQDHGHTVLIGLGEQTEKVTIVTHGDVQPADPAKWNKSPFELDRTSEPGKLIARGTEDDKGPIATALYAMKSIKDSGITLNNRLELMVYLAEESDWEPLREFMKSYEQPKYAITIDASYPVVVAEKGWSLVEQVFKDAIPEKDLTNSVYISEFKGGAFVSQIPEDASVIVHNASPKLLDTLKQSASQLPEVEFTFSTLAEGVRISAKGNSAHSSEPEAGVNAIAHLAALFDGVDLALNADGQALVFIRDLIGLDLYGKQFGDIAYRHDFMGPMTVSPTLLTTTKSGTKLSVNLRRPVGKSAAQLETEINTAISAWKMQADIILDPTNISLGEPMLLDDAPHAHVLLDVFKHFTGDDSAQFVSIGGGTNAKLFDNAVSFGPSMPGKKYTGHTEYEFLTEAQLRLNLKMYTAMMVELGNK